MKSLRLQQSLRFKLFVLLILTMSYATNNKIDVQGHRGCRGLMPENTLPAFQKAIELGVTTLELDIAITNDQEVVVSHEPFMSRTICLDSTGNEIPEALDKSYNLYEMTHDQIKLFDCGLKFHEGYPEQEKLRTYKPLLSEVFQLVKELGAEVNFNIEIKSKPEYYGVYTPEPKLYVELVLNEVEASGMSGQTNLQSFDLRILEEIKLQAPSMPVALLIDANESIGQKLKQLSYKPEIISPHYLLLTQKSVKNYKKLGYLVIPWTVNKKVDMIRLIDWNVNGIITDYPDRLLELLM